MANVRLLRQQVEDYQKKLAGSNTNYEEDYALYQSAYDAYKTEADAYNAAVNERNAQIAAANESGQRLAEPYGDGRYKVITATGNGRVAPLVTTLTKDVGPYVFKDNGKGGLTMYQLQKVNWNSYGYVGVATVGKATPIPSTQPVAPTAPEGPKPIGEINLTEKEKGLLQNPTLGPSEMSMATAKGVGGTSSLAGDETPAPSSAFADPEDPNNLKDRGVLARVLGGQL